MLYRGLNGHKSMTYSLVERYLLQYSRLEILTQSTETRSKSLTIGALRLGTRIVLASVTQKTSFAFHGVTRFGTTKLRAIFRSAHLTTQDGHAQVTSTPRTSVDCQATMLQAYEWFPHLVEIPPHREGCPKHQQQPLLSRSSRTLQVRLR